MYCGECGTKNKKGDIYCSECGKKLVTDDTKKSEVLKVKKLSKSTKIIIGIAFACITLFITLLIVFSNLTNPKNVAKEYLSAIVNKDSNKLYSYLTVNGDKTFVSKKSFNNYVKEELKDINISNYKINDVDYSAGKLQATVKFSYTLSSSSNESSSKIVLTKKKNKKYLFFDNWVVNDAVIATIVKDYTLKVIKGSSLMYDGIKVSEKYLNKNKSTDDYDIYILPQVFSYETNIKAVLPSGLEIEEKVTPSKYYNEHTVSFDEDTLTNKVKDKFTTVGKNSLNTIYKSAIENKKFTDINSKFKHGSIDLNKLEQHYNEFVSDLSSESNKLTSFSITSAKVYDIDLNEAGYIEVELRVNYDYTIKYNDYNNEEKTHSDSDYDYMTVILTYDNGNYCLVDIDDLETYFSRY